MPEVPSLDRRATWVLEGGGDEQTLEVPIKADTSYLTHGLFRYAGKLPPPLVSYLIERYSKPGDVVVDPMCGGGTTAVEAASSGREVTSFDISPVSRTVTTAVSTVSDPDELSCFSDEVRRVSASAEPPEDLRDYFSPEAYGLISTGLRLAATDAQKALMLSIARTASFANTKKINTVIDPAKQPRPAVVLLANATQKFRQGLAAFATIAPARSRVLEGQAGTLPLDDGSVDLVFLHPPYLTNTAFSESMHLQLLLTGIDPKTIRKLELAYRGSYFHVPNGLHKYLLGWAKVLREAARVVHPGGHVVVVIGDGRIDNVRIPIGTITAEFGKDMNLRLVQRAVHVLNNQTGWTLSRRMKGQHVLAFARV